MLGFSQRRSRSSKEWGSASRTRNPPVTKCVFCQSNEGIIPAKQSVRITDCETGSEGFAHDEELLGTIKIDDQSSSIVRLAASDD